jgi:ribosomal protein S18 acetylase RimI-like enzyme
MTIQDWRDAPADVVQGLLLAERRRVLEQLHWDLAPSLKAVEQARQRGELPGLILQDRHGRPVGWAFYLLANRLLQIGGLQAPTAGGLRLLLDHVLSSSEAQMAQGVACFLEATSPSLTSALTRWRFDLHRHAYLEASLTNGWPLAPTPTLRPLVLADAPELVRLLARSYAGERVARAFAPNARIEEWAQYVGQLLNGPAVGIWRPDLSLALSSPDGRLAGALVVTEVARGIAHVAQLAIDPAHRRKGLGRQLVTAAGVGAAAQGAKRLTLMVSEANEPALTLYRSLGFAPRGVFLHGVRGPVPRTLNGVTIRATGGLQKIA